MRVNLSHDEEVTFSNLVGYRGHLLWRYPHTPMTATDLRNHTSRYKTIAILAESAHPENIAFLALASSFLEVGVGHF